MISPSPIVGLTSGSPVDLPSVVDRQSSSFLSNRNTPYQNSATSESSSALQQLPLNPGPDSQGMTVLNSAPFADLLVDAVGQVAQLEKQAKASVEGLISGQGVDVHEAMIATGKAEMGFELLLSLRNKALAAYQQVVGMQF